MKQGHKIVDEWYNAVQHQLNLCKYPKETTDILQHDIFLFFLNDEDFISKTLSEIGNDSRRYTAAMARQAAKKAETSKSTAQHIKRGVSVNDPQASQVNMLRHKRTELPKPKSQRGKRRGGGRGGKQPDYNQIPHRQPQLKYKQNTSYNKCGKCGDTQHAQGFNCPARKFQCKKCRKYGHFTSLCKSDEKKGWNAHKHQVRQIRASANELYGDASEYSSSD